MSVVWTILILYLVYRFVALGRWVGEQGHHPLWVVLEYLTAVLCLLLLWPIWD